MKYFVKKLFVLFILCILGFASCKTADKVTKPVSFEVSNRSIYHAIAAAYTKQAPIMIDDNVRLESLVYLEKENMFVYYYTLVNMEKSGTPDNTWKVIKEVTRETLKENFKTQQNMEQFRKDKVKQSFVYKDKNGVEIFTVELNYDEY